MRGVILTGERRAVLIQDEVEVTRAAELTWGLMTRAAVSLKGEREAELSVDGKRLLVRALSPEGAEFAVESTKQEPPQNPNEGIQRLVLRVPAAEGPVRIAVQLAPVWPDGGAADKPAVEPLAEW